MPTLTLDSLQWNLQCPVTCYGQIVLAVQYWNDSMSDWGDRRCCQARNTEFKEQTETKY